MFGRMRKVRNATLALAFAASLGAAVTAQPANAASTTQPWLSCGEGTETIHFGLPLNAAGRWSQFVYTLDGGRTWQRTAWYYSKYGAFYIWNGRALESIRDGGGPILIVGNRMRVHGYEWNGSRNLYLGTCVTSSFFRDGIVYTYN
jgi:hypothetical protein